jgi:hypothetical protein
METTAVTQETWQADQEVRYTYLEGLRELVEQCERRRPMVRGGLIALDVGEVHPAPANLLGERLLGPPVPRPELFVK